MASFKNLVSTTSAQISSGGTITGDLVINGDLQVDGGGSLSFDEIIEGTQVIDVTNTEALLVRKDSDGGDVFIVDTTNSRVGINGTPSTELHVQSSDRTSFRLQGTATSDGVVSDIQFFNASDSVGAINMNRVSNDDQADMTFHTQPNGGSVTERMRIKSGGDVSFTGWVEGNDQNALFSSTGTGTLLQAPATTEKILFRNVNGTAGMLYDADNKRLMIGSSDNPYSPLHVKSSAEGSIGGLEGTDGTFIPQVVIEGSGTTAAKMSPTLALFNSSTGADGDTLGSIMFMGGDSTTQPPTTPANASVYAGILAKITDETNSSNDGELHFLATKGNDNTNTAMSIVGSDVTITGTATVTGALIDLRASADTDSEIIFREGSTAKAMIFNDASTNSLSLSDGGGTLSSVVNINSSNVGIGIVPVTSQKLHVNVASNVNFTTSANSSSLRLNAVNDAVDATIPLEINATNTKFLSKVGINVTPIGTLDVNISTDARGSFTDNVGEIGSGVFALQVTNADGSALKPMGIRAEDIRLVTGSAIRLKLDDNSRISLSNNDAGNNSNTFFGKLAGDSIQSGGNDNCCFGHEAGKALTTGDTNTLLGTKAGTAMATGQNNVMIGNLTGDATDGSSLNVFIGSGAVGASDATQNGTVAIGYNSLHALTSGISNVAVGYESAKNLTTGASNVSIGYNSMGNSHLGCDKNVIIGTSAFFNGEVDQAVFIGFNAGGDGTTTTGANGSVGIGKSSLNNLTSGQYNVAVGYEALKAEDDGDYNTAIGYDALKLQTGVSGTVGNTSIGAMSGDAVTTGKQNTFVGAFAGSGTADVDATVAIGYGAMGNNNVTSASDGTIAIGDLALANLVNGARNVAIGRSAMLDSQGAGDNVAIGHEVLKEGTTSEQNTAVGTYSLGSNAAAALTGNANTAIGYQSLYVAQGASTNNTALGKSSATNITTGSNNCIIGVSAGANTVALTTGSDNTLVGTLSDVSASGASNQIVIGKSAKGVGDNSVTLGNADVTAVYMAQDSGATVHCAGVAVSEGINFPDDAATGHSSDVNTLDNYEEGTWTATDGSGASLSLTLEENTYVKIGRLVTAHMIVTFPTTSDSNLATLTLPFTAESIGSSAGGVVLEQNITSSHTFTACVNGSNALIFRLAGVTGQTNVNLSGKKLRFAITYMS